MKESPRLQVVMPEELDEKLNRVSDEYGLSKSEIARRGIVREIGDLE